MTRWAEYPNLHGQVIGETSTPLSTNCLIVQGPFSLDRFGGARDELEASRHHGLREIIELQIQLINLGQLGPDCFLRRGGENEKARKAVGIIRVPLNTL